MDGTDHHWRSRGMPATIVPIHGVYTLDGMEFAFGIVLLPLSAFTRYLVASLYILKANEVMCDDRRRGGTLWI